MAKIQIKVLKTLVLEEFQKYIKTHIEKCPIFTVGQVFETEYEKPYGFCDWAWNDIHPYISSLLTGGNFSEGMFQNWMKDKNSIVACCTDGVRPVIFEIKRIET
jgi:uncharacterized repeat protein (TIGR04076 family)